MSNKIIYGLYADDDQLLEAAKKIGEKGHHINEVYTPFPVHGLDSAIGLPYSRMAVTSFLFGMTGAFLITLLVWYVMVEDWPLVIGGKPNFTYGQNLPAFIPVTFEATVFCAAHLMVLTFLFRCKLFPGSSSRNPDPRTTDDKFLMEIHESDARKITEIKKIMKQTGAEEIKVKNNENELLEEFEEIRKKETKKIMRANKKKQSFMKTTFNKIFKK